MRLLLAGTLIGTSLAVAGPAAMATAAVGEVPQCGGRAATIVEPSADGMFRGTPHDDVIVGTAFKDRFEGRGGDDVICAGGGGDRIYGGRGNDRLYGEDDGYGEAEIEHGDRLDGGPGDDLLEGGFEGATPDEGAHVGDDDDLIMFQSAGHGVHVDLAAGTVTGQGHDTIGGTRVQVWGSRHDDVIDGSDLQDSLFGGGGDDVLRGADGRDWLAPGRGPDGRLRLFGGPGDDYLTGDAGGRDRLDGGGGDDSLSLPGPGTALGGHGDDRVGASLAKGRHQELVGGPGKDAVGIGLAAATDLTTDFGAGRARVPAWGLTVRMRGFGEARVGSYERLTWTARGTSYPEVFVTSRSVRLVVHAGAGGDLITGSRRGDRIDGGPGRDEARALAGRDTCTSVESLPYDDCERVN